MIKSIHFCGSSRKDVAAFPQEARREAGYQLMQVQFGREPDSWRPMNSVGMGAKEIRIHNAGQFRIIYVAQLVDAIHVLHAFQKKSQKTARKDIALARKRYKEVMHG